jgi:hypothetical protein
MRSVHETSITMLFDKRNCSGIFRYSRRSFLCNEFPQEGLALKSFDFLEIRAKKNIPGPSYVGYASLVCISCRIYFRVGFQPVRTLTTN